MIKSLGLLAKAEEKGSVIQHVDLRRYRDGHLIRSMPFGEGMTREYGAPWMYEHVPMKLLNQVKRCH
jgi:salicylate hydroxylase